MTTEVELVKLSALTTIADDLASLTAADRIQTGLDVVATNVAKEAAEAAASVSGPVHFYDTFTDAEAAVASLIAGDIVEVMADETLSDLRTRYLVESPAALAFRLLLSPVVTATAAALRAIPYSGAFTQAETLGSLAASDGGGGTWRWNAAANADDDVGTVIKPTGHVGDGRWERVYTGAIYADWFGTVGDCATDDTTALQAACDHANPVVVFTPGKTYIADGLQINTANKTVLAQGATLKLKNSATTKGLLRVNAAGVTIDGGTFDGNKSNGNAPVNTYTSYGIALLADNCTIKNAASINTHGIGFKGLGNYLSFLNNSIENTTHYGIFVDASAGTDYYGNRAIGNRIDMSEGGSIGQGILFMAGPGHYQIDWEISRNTVTGPSSNGIADQAINLGCRGRRGLVTDNQTRYGSMGFSEGGDQTVISNNTFLDLRGTARYGIEPTGGDTIIANNIVTNALQGVSFSSARSPSGTMDNLVISDNQIKCDLTEISIGILLQIPEAVTGHNIHISGNYVSAFRSIQTLRDITGLSVIGNKFIGTNATPKEGHGLFLGTPPTAPYVYVANNQFNGMNRPLYVFSTTDLAISHLYALGNSMVHVGDDGIYGGNGSRWIMSGGGVFTMGSGIMVAWGTGGLGNLLSQKHDLRVVTSDATPENDVPAGVGSLCLNVGGGAGTSLYVKQSGSGNTGWVGK